MSSIENMSADYNISAMIGKDGNILVTDTTAITGSFRAIVVLTDAAFTTLTTPGVTKNGTVTACTGADWGTLAAGAYPMRVTACTLSSGKVLLVK